MKKRISLAALLLVAAQSASANPFGEAVKMQRANEAETMNQEAVAASVEQTKREMNEILQALFFDYYKEVKKSGLKLINPEIPINEINTFRQRTGNCCSIYVSSRLDGGMYVTTSDGGGLFAIDGYNLQSVSGIILDDGFERTGRLSPQCRYEVNISYKNSRTYDCAAFRARKIDAQVVEGMKEMLPKAMKDYRR